MRPELLLASWQRPCRMKSLGEFSASAHESVMLLFIHLLIAIAPDDGR